MASSNWYITAIVMGTIIKTVSVRPAIRIIHGWEKISKGCSNNMPSGVVRLC